MFYPSKQVPNNNKFKTMERNSQNRRNDNSKGKGKACFYNTTPLWLTNRFWAKEKKSETRVRRIDFFFSFGSRLISFSVDLITRSGVSMDDRLID